MAVAIHERLCASVQVQYEGVGDPCNNSDEHRGHQRSYGQVFVGEEERGRSRVRPEQPASDRRTLPAHRPPALGAAGQSGTAGPNSIIRPPYAARCTAVAADRRLMEIQTLGADLRAYWMRVSMSGDCVIARWLLHDSILKLIYKMIFVHP